MNAQTLLFTFLFLHLIGLVLLAGATFIDLIVYRQFWKAYGRGNGKGVTIVQTLSKLAVLMPIGGITLIATGVGMMAVTHGAFDQFLWFRVKMIIVLLLILNIVLLGKKNATRLTRAINQNEQLSPRKLASLRRNISTYQYVQVVFLLLIMFLSVFKFS